jgi:hypothetical protein
MRGWEDVGRKEKRWNTNVLCVYAETNTVPRNNSTMTTRTTTRALGCSLVLSRPLLSLSPEIHTLMHAFGLMDGCGGRCRCGI